jgi:hypothetical protein
LLDVRSVTGEVLLAVLREHDCSRRECPVCGYVPTRRQRVCRSVAVAQGVVGGRAPRWAGDDPVEAPESGVSSGAEQCELFSTAGVGGPGDGRRGPGTGRA